MVQLGDMGGCRGRPDAHVCGRGQLVHSESGDPLGLGGVNDGVWLGWSRLGVPTGRDLVPSLGFKVSSERWGSEEELAETRFS